MAEHLPRDEVTLEPDYCTCPACGGPLHPIGVTTSEMLDWVPASVRVTLAACWAHVRRKFYDLNQATGSPIAAEALTRGAALAI